jgi:RNA polymerase sigma-70 factor (ECF subfamily)
MNTRARPDDELLRLTREGDREAFVALHGRFAPPGYALAFRLSGNADLAADVVQDAFIALINGSQAYRFDGRLRAYFLRMIANSVFSLQRSVRAQASALSRWAPVSEPLPNGLALQSLTADAAWGALRRLSHVERVVVILRACLDLKFREIADVLAESESAAKMRYYRAIARLREALNAWEDPE